METEKEKYKEMFLSESKENLQLMNTSLLKLEKKQEPKLIDELFRAVHSLKAMAATMNYNKMAELCHAMEDILVEVKNRERKLTPEIIEIFFKGFDNLEVSVKKIAEDGVEAPVDALVSELNLIFRGKSEASEALEGSAATEANSEGITLAERPETIEKIESIKVKVETLDTLMNLIEELLVNKMRLNQIYASKKIEEMDTVLGMLGRLVTEIQFNVVQARMVSVEQIFNRFPRMVRDLAKKEGKQVNLVIEGSEIELDRTIIDKLGEPLVHLLRNAVDHGIEKQEVRAKINKPEIGTIKLVARRERGYAIIEVDDDGNGLDIEKIKQVAIKRKILTESEAAKMGDEKIKELLYDHNISTVEEATEVSGRGVGLNVVKTMIDTLGGSYKIDYRPGKGMKVTLELPLTLAIIRALLTKVGEEIYAIPLTNIVRSVRLKKENIRGMLNNEVAVLQEANVPLLRLYNLFNLPHEKEEGALVVIVKRGEEFIGLGVDTLINEQEIIIKPMDKLIKQNKAFAGFTILGDGKAALVLDVGGLI